MGKLPLCDPCGDGFYDSQDTLLLEARGQAVGTI